MKLRSKSKLYNYFDRVVLINLRRRTDRLLQCKNELEICDWPFKAPEIFPAIEGAAVPRPSRWRYGTGALGCLRSHAQVLQSAIHDNLDNILVLEDDVCFNDDFAIEISKFLSFVPDDWDQLMIGGQHYKPPILVKHGIKRCTDCERTHCYAVSKEFMRKLCNRWQGGGIFNGIAHCDWIMGRDPELQLAHNVYAPNLFLAGQQRSHSDVAGKLLPRKFWNPPPPDMMVVYLHAPAIVAKELSMLGFYMDHWFFQSPENETVTLDQIFQNSGDDQTACIKALRTWINSAQWELAADPTFVCTIWHPKATPKLVKAASAWEICEIKAKNINDVYEQLPVKLKKNLFAVSCRKSLRNNYLI